MLRFMTAHSFSSSLLIPHPLSHTLISPLLGLVAVLRTKEMAILRPLLLPLMLALKELSISSARA